MIDLHHTRELVEMTVLGLLVALLVHFVEFGVTTVRATARTFSPAWPARARVLLWLFSLAARLFAGSMLLLGLIQVVDALAPFAVPDWAGWGLLLALVAIAAAAEALWHRLVTHSLRAWEDRCRRPDMLGHHGDDARIVGWRVARSMHRYGSTCLGATVGAIVALGMFLANAPTSGPADLVVLMGTLTVWGVILIAADSAVTFLDPLARLVQQLWLDRAQDDEEPPTRQGADAVVNPLRLAETSTQKVRHRKRRSTWIAALALKRVALRYPAGVTTEEGRIALLTQLAAPGTDLTDEMRRMVDAIIREEIPATGITTDIAKRSWPPVFDRLRPWLLGRTAAVVVIGSLVTAVVKPALEIYHRLNQ
ncbi:hypothetical protein [Pimelobacter sp. 30-1]|uniref:hypothetical protein n=1 Tax=Pimelobacter sp. 30-1 TaxID=2004991 RepID=UPI001C05E075|nr:hypothetical protein [Pimelobacter sp. 30-1]